MQWMQTLQVRSASIVGISSVHLCMMRAMRYHIRCGEDSSFAPHTTTGCTASAQQLYDTGCSTECSLPSVSITQSSSQGAAELTCSVRAGQSSRLTGPASCLHQAAWPSSITAQDAQWRGIVVQQQPQPPGSSTSHLKPRPPSLGQLQVGRGPALALSRCWPAAVSQPTSRTCCSRLSGQTRACRCRRSSTGMQQSVAWHCCHH
jgi:hypothetical protein